MAAEEIENLNLPLDFISNVLRHGTGGPLDMVLKYLIYKSNKDSSKFEAPLIIKDLMDLSCKESNAYGQAALDCLTNLAGTSSGATSIIASLDTNVKNLIKHVLKRDSILADRASKSLSNLTRDEINSLAVYRTVLEMDCLDDMVEAICNKSYNSKEQKMEYLAQVFGNLTQVTEFRILIMKPDRLQRVLPIIHNGNTPVERYGIAAALYNCLFDPNNHKVLLEEPFDILPIILYPLAGPEEFDEEDYEKMPLELQYLPDDKTRESDINIRNLLLKSLLLLCSRKSSRTFIRDKNSYFILREYHKWEENRENLLALENVIDILIRTEEEIGVDDIKSIDVPDELIEKFNKMDKDFVSEIRKTS